MSKRTIRVESCPLVEVWRVVMPPSAISHLLLYSREYFVSDVHLTLPLDDENEQGEIACFMIVPSALVLETKVALTTFAEQHDLDLELGNGSHTV